jgi:hypothetical protein
LILDRLAWWQLEEWMIYERMEPFGDRRADWQAASICAATMNAAVLQRTGKVQMLFRPAQFLLEFNDEPVAAKKEGEPAPAPTQNWQGMKFIARQMTALANAEAKVAAKRKRR